MSIPADQIERARDTDLLDLTQNYVRLKRVTANEYAGPCPACGRGDDRFAVNVRSRAWLCRQCGIKGKGAIDLVMQVENCRFGQAVSRLTGASWRPAKATSPIPTEGFADDRANSVAKARQRWNESADPNGTIVEKYLRDRGLDLTDDIAGEVIRFHPTCPWKDEDGSLIRVPAMINEDIE